METKSLVIYIVAGVILFLTILTTAIVLGLAKRRRQKLESEGAPEEGPEQLPRGAKGERTYEEITYAYKHFRGTDKAPPNFSITIPCTSTGNFTIKRETKFDRFFKRLGVSVEIGTHDPSFDDAFYISTDTIPFARTYLERSENRRAVQALFDLGFNHLKHNGKSMVLTWRNFPRRQLMAVETMEKAVVQLALLVRALDKTPSYETPASVIPTWKIKRLFVFAVTGIALVGGITTLIIGLVSYRPLDVGKVFVKSLTYSVPLFVLFCWIALRLLKGRSSSHWELTTVFFISLVAFPVGGFGCTTFFNGVLDKGTPAVHRVKVIKKYYSKSKDDTTYYAVVNSWRDDPSRTIEKLRVSRQFYHSLQPGTSVMEVTTKPGKYGFEWIVHKSSGSD